MRVIGVFLEYEGKFVILRRQNHKPEGGTWCLPSGKVEIGESDEASAVRELVEETGYQASHSQLQHLGNDTFQFGTDQPYVFITYRLVLDKSHAVILEDRSHSEYRWVTAQECDSLPDLIPGFHTVLARIGFTSSSLD